MMRATIAGRSLCAKPGSTSTGYSIDYAGEFNKYLAKVGWDGLASIIVPISFSAYDDCYSPAVSLSTIAIPSGSVSVVLEPVASSPLSTDTDGEGVLDAKEREIRTNALMANSDNDQKTQGTELWDCTDLRETNAADTTCELTTPDPLLGTDPISADTDADGIADGIDANPFSADSDGDGVLDGAEAALGTDPNNADTDKDYFLDATDMVLVCTSQLAQSWISKGVKYDDIGGGSCRFIGEFTWGTKPLVADTDGDWLKDGEEGKPIP